MQQHKISNATWNMLNESSHTKSYILLLYDMLDTTWIENRYLLGAEVQWKGTWGDFGVVVIQVFHILNVM